MPAPWKFYRRGNAFDFSWRTGFALRQQPGLPPALVPPIKVDRETDGTVSYQGVPLPPFVPGNVPDVMPVPGESIVRPLPEYEPQWYGDAITFPVVFAAAGERLVLSRPNAWRTSLLIVNFSVVGNIFYAFDRVADNLSCVPIVAGGNRLFDVSVPQGDLHLFSSGAGIVIVEYMNREIKQESYR